MAWWDRFLGRRLRPRRVRSGAISGRGPEALEVRKLLAAQVTMLAATTLDSKGVTVGYRIDGGSLDAPLTLGVYRSTDATFDASDKPVGTAVIDSAALDVAGASALGEGTHAVTEAIPGGLPPDPTRPYVLVVADPLRDGGADPGQSAAFRTHVMGVVVHGGLQPASAKANGPDWELRMAASLRAQGYDLVVPYNWVSESSTAGAAVKQGPRLARAIEAAAAAFPAGDVVDLHVIGHSQGAVIAGQALARLDPPANLARGYVELTMLDPHAAANGVAGPQYSIKNDLLGRIAKGAIDAYQAKSNDPPPYIPANVDDAQVYFQKTPVAIAQAGNKDLYNLWGQVPVFAAPGVPVHYSDLTGPGISHSGKFSVHDWYQVNVVPKLGDGPAFVDPGHLTAARLPGPGRAATFAGEAFPGSKVELSVASGAGGKTAVIGRTTATADGTWSITPGAPGKAVKAAISSTVKVG